MNKKFIIPLIILILLLIAGEVFWWWQSGKEKKGLPTELPKGIEYATPETGVIEGVVKPAPFNPEDVVVDPETGTKIIKDEIGILFKDDVSEEERNEIIASINGEIVGYGLAGQDVEVKIKGNPSIDDLKRIIEELKKNPKVDYASLSRVGTIVPKRVPDVGKDSQWKDSWNEENPSGKNWGLEAIYAPSAWDYNDSIKPVKIGIFDIGFAINHEDLRIPENNTNLAPQKGIDEINLYLASLEKRKECVLEEGEVINHGTHVAGIIGALSNNEVGVTGTVWNRDLSIYEVNLKEFDLKRGIEWLLNRDSKIINISWGFQFKCSSKEEIEDAQRYYNKVLEDWVKKYNNFLIVQSAGNSDIDARKEVIFNPQLDKPKYEELKNIVITVGAAELNPGKIKSFFTGDWDKTFFAKGKGQYILASFSNYGDLIDVVAPGVNIYSTLKDESKFKSLLSGLSCFDSFNNSYGCKSGTSMAAPFVTGVAGLVWGAAPDLTAEQVKEIIVNSADRPISYKGKEYKIPNAKNSVELALGESKKFVEEKIKEEKTTEKPDLLKETGPAALVPKPPAEEKPKEEITEKNISEAKPLPNGVTIANLSIALTKIERTNNPPLSSPDPGIDYVFLEFTLRKIKNLDESNLSFSTELIDDHNNVYGEENLVHPSGVYGSCYARKIEPKIGIAGLGGSYCNTWSAPDIDEAPIGFTWRVPLSPYKIPSSAPLTKLRIYYQKEPRSEKIELTIINLSTFKPVQIKDFNSQLKNEDIIFLPYEISKEEYFSAVMLKMKKIKQKIKYKNITVESFEVPIVLKNTDYNPTLFNLGEIGIQTLDGDVWWGYYGGMEVPTSKASIEIPGSSEETVELTPVFYEIQDNQGKIFYATGKGINSLLFRNLPGKTSKHFIILKVAPENFE